MGRKYFQMIRVVGQLDVQALIEIFHLFIEDFSPG
jgi:hypothetical protein